MSLEVRMKLFMNAMVELLSCKICQYYSANLANGSSKFAPLIDDVHQQIMYALEHNIYIGCMIQGENGLV